MAYSKVNWTESTDVDAVNLDTMDQGIADAARQDQNLSDLGNAGTARNNLGLGSMATRNTGTGGTQHRTNSQNDDRFALTSHGSHVSTGERSNINDGSFLYPGGLSIEFIPENSANPLTGAGVLTTLKSDSGSGLGGRTVQTFTASVTASDRGRMFSRSNTSSTQWSDWRETT